MLTEEIIASVVEAQDLGLTEAEVFELCNKLCGFVGESKTVMLTKDILKAVELKREESLIS